MPAELDNEMQRGDD